MVSTSGHHDEGMLEVREEAEKMRKTKFNPLTLAGMYQKGIPQEEPSLGGKGRGRGSKIP
jgi:hypothetical protein